MLFTDSVLLELTPLRGISPSPMRHWIRFCIFLLANGEMEDVIAFLRAEICNGGGQCAIGSSVDLFVRR
jgi:hypothetical protein